MLEKVRQKKYVRKSMLVKVYQKKYVRKRLLEKKLEKVQMPKKCGKNEYNSRLIDWVSGGGKSSGTDRQKFGDT